MSDQKWYSIEARGNREAEVYIYDEIGAYGVSAKQFATDLRAIGDVDLIVVRINSPGGSVVDGSAIYNLLADHSAAVSVKIDGAAWSMASVIAMAGDQIEMAENALMMIHLPSMPAFGNADDMRKAADILDKFRDSLIGAYTKKTGKGADDIIAMLEAETWLTAAEAVEQGFADSITGAMEMAAHWDAEQYFGGSTAVEAKQISKPAAVDAVAEPEGDTMPDKDKASATPDEIKAAADAAVMAERKRVADIRAVFAPFSVDHLPTMQAAIDNGLSVEDAQKSALDALAKTAQPVATAAVEAGEDQRDKFRTAAVGALSAKAGIGDRDGQNEINGLSLREIARASLAAVNVGVSGRTAMDVVGMAFTHSSSDFSNILADVANKSMLRGFAEAEETFQLWTVRGEMSDFKTANRVGATGFASLREVKENGEYKSLTMSDYKETNRLATYGELFGISRQAIINDDLRAFTVIPRNMGRAAIRTVGDLAYAVLTNNAAMSDGVALFHANHSNLNATGTAISTASIQAIRAAMAKQTGRDSNVTALNIRPSILLAPVALEGTALQVRDSETEIAASQNNSRRPNVVRGTFEVVTDARLDVADANDWYMLASPSAYDTVEVAYLDGNDQPYLEQQEGWSVDGTQFKVRIDAGCAPLEFASMYKQVGA